MKPTSLEKEIEKILEEYIGKGIYKHYPERVEKLLTLFSSCLDDVIGEDVAEVLKDLRSKEWDYDDSVSKVLVLDILEGINKRQRQRKKRWFK